MPQQSTINKARADKRAGKSASTQAGEFVHDEIKRIRAGKHGAKNAKQAIAIGLSEARRAGVDIPERKSAKSGTRAKATRAGTKKKSTATKRTTSARRSAAATKALRKQPRRAASHLALSRQAHRVARTRAG